MVAAAVDERSKTVSQIKEIFVSCLSKSEDSLIHLKQFLQHSAIAVLGEKSSLSVILFS